MTMTQEIIAAHSGTADLTGDADIAFSTAAMTEGVLTHICIS